MTPFGFSSPRQPSSGLVALSADGGVGSTRLLGAAAAVDSAEAVGGGGEGEADCASP